MLSGSHRWQTLLAAVIAGVAAIVAALLAGEGGDRNETPPPAIAGVTPTSSGAAAESSASSTRIPDAATPSGLVAPRLSSGTGSMPEVKGGVVGQSADPERQGGVILHFAGSVSGLAPGQAVFALVTRRDLQSSFPAETATVDRQKGTWTADVRVPTPTLDLQYSCGAIDNSDDGIAHAAPPPTARQRLQREGLDAAGIVVFSEPQPLTLTPTS